MSLTLIAHCSKGVGRTPIEELINEYNYDRSDSFHNGRNPIYRECTTMLLKGQFRTGYFIQAIFVVIVMIVPVVWLLQDDGTGTSLNRNRYWYAAAAFLWLFGGAFFFLSISYYVIEINNEGIVYTSVTGKRRKYKFEEIATVKSSISYERHSTRHETITIEFTDGRLLRISATLYSNFAKIKRAIYKWNANDE
ncbi:MAG: hypothetical protein ABJA70_14465 [Chryseolinea sp.]